MANTDMDAYIEARTDTKTFTANWLNYCNRENKYIVYVHMNTYANVLTMLSTSKCANNSQSLLT